MAYTTTNKAHTHHNTRSADGQPTTHYSRYETGLITGRNRDLPAVLADCTGFDGLGFDANVGSDDDSWYMLNAFDNKGSYVDTIAVGGAMNADHATIVAQTQLGHLGASSVALIGLGLTQFDSVNQSPVGTFSIDAIKKLMHNPSQDKAYLPIITAAELAIETDRVTFDSVEWADNSDELLSHDGRDSSLLLDMTRADTRNDLVSEFDLADTLQLLGANAQQSFDSLMDTKNRLPLLRDRLYKALARAGNNDLSVESVVETKPFKRQGVSNIAFVFGLSDGQKLSIWFHNPDSTPSKLMPSDIMISWKWMLNKRDVTAALSPKQGDNVQLPVLASRIMRVAAKNSKIFKRTQARRLKLKQELLDAQALIDTKNTTIDQLDKDIESLTAKLDEAMKTPVSDTVNESGLQADDNYVSEDTAVTDVLPTVIDDVIETPINGLVPDTEPEIEVTKSLIGQSVIDFAKTHAGFEGFIDSNNDAEAALASKPKGHWVVKVDDSAYPVNVFMSLDDNSENYTGAMNVDVESAFNDILDKSKVAAIHWGVDDKPSDINLNDDDDDDESTDNEGANNKKIIKGKSNKAKTPKGTKIESRFALVDAKFLIASHTAAGGKNPKYPQELQPRDRARESSIAWVQKTSKALDPESLGRTGRVDTGAPIVGEDLVVESGNGRTIAIKMAYANGDAGEYKEWLAENADMFGMTEMQVNSYKHPVLVRIRTTEVNRAEFAVEANQDDKLSFTASERAKADAKRVSDGMLELFDPSESGDILAASNRDFVKSFLASLGATEAAQYTDSNGNPTQALVARIKGALFSKAYDDDRLLEMMADQTKPDLQNMLNALTMAAPKFVAAQAVNRSDAQDLAGKVVDGIEQSLSDEVKAAIVDATNMIMNAKLSNQDIKEYVLQQGLFEQVDDAVADLAIFLASNARSAKKMTEYFNAMAGYIEQDNVSRQNLDMFGEPEPLSLADVIAYANNKTSETDNTGTPDMFDEPAAAPVVEPVVEPAVGTEGQNDKRPSEFTPKKAKGVTDAALALVNTAINDGWQAAKPEFDLYFTMQKTIDNNKLSLWVDEKGGVTAVLSKDNSLVFDQMKFGLQANTDIANHYEFLMELISGYQAKQSEVVTPLDDFNATNLAAKVDAIANEVNSSDFDPEIFDVDALIDIVDEASGNADLSAKLDEISKTYQSKLIAISMQALSDAAGQ